MVCGEDQHAKSCQQLCDALCYSLSNTRCVENYNNSIRYNHQKVSSQTRALNGFRNQTEDQISQEDQEVS